MKRFVSGEEVAPREIKSPLSITTRASLSPHLQAMDYCVRDSAVNTPKSHCATHYLLF